MKIKISFLFTFMIVLNIALAQVMETNSVLVNKTWIDKNGQNTLTVYVDAACNPEKPPFDGHETSITASLVNKNYQSQMIYDEKEYEMKMILFYEKDIWYCDLNGIKAVFIPFFYCCNADRQVTVSYIIFYNNEKYLFHLDFICNEDGSCIFKDDLKKVTGGMSSSKLRNEFIKQIKIKYKTYKDFYLDF